MDSYSVFLARVSNVPVSGFRIRISILITFYCFIHSVSSTFSSKSSCLIIPHKSVEKHGQLLGFCSTYFKRTGLGFPNQGYDFKHFFTALYPLFLRHSIRITISILITFYCFIHSISSTFSSKSSCLMIPHKSVKKTQTVTWFLQYVFQT